MLAAGIAPAAPYVPASDGQILERLPLKPSDPITREISQLRVEHRKDPGNVDVAVRLARRYYELVGEEGDPRYLGYAEAALAPWWNMDAPPVEVQVVRASLRQFRHDFSGAVADLDAVVERAPDHVAARALRATIHIVQARYEQARPDCSAMRKLGSELTGIGCEAMVDGLTGNAASAYQSLLGAESKARQAPAEQRLWTQIRLAEIAQRLEKSESAEGHYREALRLGLNDTFLLAAYADFLLDRDRPADVVNLLKGKTRSDVLLLRLMFAERALRLPSAKETEATLAARYQAAQMRGDTAHQQEEARFALHVEKKPEKALALARENWKVQREPRDARIFLEAALAAKDLPGAQPVLQWLEASRIEDNLLRKLGQQLKDVRK